MREPRNSQPAVTESAVIVIIRADGEPASEPASASSKKFNLSSPSVTQATQGHLALKALEHALPYLGR